jgi:hypothetical protein
VLIASTEISSTSSIGRALPVAVQRVACDREQVRAEAALAAKLVALADTREERLLHQIIDLAIDLALEEPIQRFEVAREQLVSRFRVPIAPPIQKRQIVHPASVAHWSDAIDRPERPERGRGGPPRRRRLAPTSW